MRGLHMVADIQYLHYREALMWKCKRDYKESQKYKETTFIFGKEKYCTWELALNKKVNDVPKCYYGDVNCDPCLCTLQSPVSTSLLVAPSYFMP